MNRAFPEKNVGNSNNIETPVQLLEPYEIYEEFYATPCLGKFLTMSTEFDKNSSK